MSERGYKVRIRPPERGDVGMLVAMIGPLVDLDAAALSRALANGPAIVGENMARGEAEQLLGVFTSLGADAELLLPDGSVNEPEPLSENNTLPLHAKGIAAALDAVTGRNPTQPFDARALRAKADARTRAARQATTPPAGSAVRQSQTQPFNPRALRAAAAQLQGEELSGPPSDQAPSTRPMEISPALRRGAPVRTSRDGATGLPAPRMAQGSQLTRPRSVPNARSAASVPPAGMSLRGSAPPRGQPIRSGPPKPRPGLPPPVKLAGLPPVEDDLVDSVDTASVAFDPKSSNPPRISAPPGPITDSHPQPDRSRGEAIRETVQSAQLAPVKHSVGWAVALAIVLPGMGQLYNGQRNRAVWFAVGALVVLPWIVSIFDAASVARAIRERRERAPHPVSRRAAFPGQLVLDFAVFVALAGGLTLLVHAMDQDDLTDPTQPIATRTRGAAGTTPSTGPVSQASTSAPANAAPTTAAPTIAAPVTAAPVTAAPVTAPVTAAPVTAAPISVAPVTAAPPSLQPASQASRAPAFVPPKPVEIDDLLAQGRTACGEGRFAACEALMQQIIDREPNHREAHQLRVDAISQQGNRARRSSPTSVAPTVPVP